MNKLLKVAYSYSQAAKNPENAIGFIGLGLMGLPMARNLVKKGFLVTGYDPDVSKHEELRRNDINPISSLKELVSTHKNLITMVPNSDHVKSVCQSDDGVFKNARKDTLLLVSSTISPFVAKEMNQEGKSHGIHVIDSPVSGGVVAAENGTLTFMVGTKEEELFKRINKFLEAMGKNIYQCGEPGSGEIAKVCNNLALGIEMVAVAEALALGEKLGMDLKTLSKIMGVSTSRCWVLDTYNPVPGVMETSPASRGYTGGFASDLLLKDLKIAMDTKKIAGAHTPLGEHTTQIYNELIERGLAKKDFSVIFDVLSKYKS